MTAGHPCRPPNVAQVSDLDNGWWLGLTVAGLTRPLADPVPPARYPGAESLRRLAGCGR
jgi:hypothetical protein